MCYFNLFVDNGVSELMQCSEKDDYMPEKRKV